jgi:hypothetical protein
MKEIILIVATSLLSMALAFVLHMLVHSDIYALKEQESSYLEHIGIHPHDYPDSLAERD